MKKNDDIRRYAQSNGLTLREVAQIIGIKYSVLVGWLNEELTPQRRTIIKEAIDGKETDIGKTRSGGCKFNAGVVCTDHSKCAGCGWNPDKKRKVGK